MDALRARQDEQDACREAAQRERHQQQRRDDEARRQANEQYSRSRLDPELQRRAALTAQKAALEGDNTQLRHELDRLNDTREALGREVQRQTAIEASLTQQRADRLVVRDNLSAATETLSRQNSVLSQQVERLSQQKAALETARNAASRDLEAIERENRRLRQLLTGCLDGDRIRSCPNNLHNQDPNHYCPSCPFAIIAYHRTTEQSAKNIQSVGIDISHCKENRCAGKGFYCASAEFITNHKVPDPRRAESTWMVKLGLRLRNVLELDHRDTSLNERALRLRNIDSVILTSENGLEFIIWPTFCKSTGLTIPGLSGHYDAVSVCVE
ncbi:unnamed protein product [Vitrella brassicaformis CCMP3155]|uniref:Uncharacterized protein n=2 Tax=Vitrella brassicaformis TaxID=1169539 RepID=A0A0G4GMV7_VITBC|nr:unnamed protein product [Vitrella brassicaformis CCMP3155]|eukprot:CEM31528.1 unnamed protein product [Vitrella brassicaformis CCMP3155]